MHDSTLVRSGLVFYVIFTGIALFLLWRNSAAPDGLKNVGILLVSILPVLITVLPYLNPEKVEEHFTFILFYDSTEKELIFGDRPNPYYSNYIPMITNLSEIPDSLKAASFSELMESKGLNIIEKGIIEALLLKFQTHWDIEQPQKFEGPVGRSESWALNSKFETKSIKLAEIRDLFKHNPLISKPGVIVFPQMNVPPNCKIKVEVEKNARTIIFTNPYVTLRIAFRASSGVVAQQGVWGVIKPDPHNMNRYYSIEYKVDAALFINRTKVYSPEMKNYRRWFENVCDSLSKYDWNAVDNMIERSLNREAIAKTLGV